MTIKDIADKARRILGDTDGTTWSNERIIDICDAGLRDISKYSGTFRSEHYVELQNYRYKYPLPLDTLYVTSIEYLGKDVPLLNRGDKASSLYATKDQLNRGTIEFINMPVLPTRDSRFIKSPSVDNIKLPLVPIDADDGWVWGVVTSESTSDEGVTTGLVASAEIYDLAPKAVFGLLSDIRTEGTDVSIGTTGETYGVLTNIAGLNSANQELANGGSIGTISSGNHKIVGRYGIVTSVLRKEEYIKIRYKGLPPKIKSLDTAFPLSYSWLEPMVNWVVGSALQDDNDGGNLKRAEIFLGRYTRELEFEKDKSAKDYSSASKKYLTKYRGGITDG